MKPLLAVACFTIFFQPFAQGQANSWNLPISNPVTDNLNDVYFVDALKGWAVGVNGSIAKTTDGGQHWLSQYDEYTLVLRDVFFLDSLHGWALGRNNIPGYVPRIFKTVNGGQTWFGHMTGVEDALHFVSLTTGFVAGGVGIIRKSTDGGESWTDVPKATTRRLRSIFFLNQTLGWCAGDTGTVLRTTDNGMNWTTVHVPTLSDLRSIHFTTANIGWCVGFDGTILRTIDGGSNWTQQPSGTGAALYAIRVFDSFTAVAVGEGGLVLKTTNAGETWFGQSTGTTKTLQGVFFLTPEYGWTVGQGGTILTTSNGGGTADLIAPVLSSPVSNAIDISVSPTLQWNGIPNSSNYTAQIAINRAFTQSLQQKTSLSDTVVSFSNLIGDSTYYWRIGSTFGNGPIIWSVPRKFHTAFSIPSAPQTAKPPSSEPMVPTTVRLVWKKTRMATTYHLQVDEHSDFNPPVIDITNISDTSYILSGLKYSSLNRTRYYFWRVSAVNNVGEGEFSKYASFTTESNDWKRIDYDKIFDVIQCHYFLTPLYGFVGTTGRRVYRTMDGGISWSSDTLPAPAQYYDAVKSIYFVDSLLGYCIIDQGHIFKTTDGGHVWKVKENSYGGWGKKIL